LLQVGDGALEHGEFFGRTRARVSGHGDGSEGDIGESTNCQDPGVSERWSFGRLDVTSQTDALGAADGDQVCETDILQDREDYEVIAKDV
jgi:hypothetical protein